MEEQKGKALQIVKNIKLLEGVFKTSPDNVQRKRVKQEINNLKKMLQEMHPNAKLDTLIEAIHSELMTPKAMKEVDPGFSEFEHLKEVEITKFSTYKDDREVNDAASIMTHFEDRIWGVFADQHTKLDFSNSGERDALYRKLDQCNRSLKVFSQTIDDIGKSKSKEYVSQLNFMRVKQARIFLYALHEFFAEARDLLANLISDAEFGGTMILNTEDRVEYADYENYKTFDNWTVVSCLKYMKKFLDEALSVIKIPTIGKKKQ